MDYSTRKLVKQGFYPLRGSFDLENGPVCPFGPTDSFAKVLTDVHEIFWQNDVRNLDHQKIHEL
ncbi:hypothetical protein H5410_056453 [Solanum commersonii]|uniref:Uncharacterized protein n=1 Tax=Solanum commersonii TaxID=4109 RepID=A0A9J5WM75_SOLCO|nr:hypothetical protein H5410_056453 [Solanum commersonii]